MEAQAIHPLAAYRARKGFSQEELAKQLGVSEGTVSRWEAGKRDPKPEQLPVICAKTGIPPAALRPDLAALFTAAQKMRGGSPRRRKARVTSRAA